MNSNLVDAALSFVTGVVLMLMWLLGAYLVEGARGAGVAKAKSAVEGEYEVFNREVWLKSTRFEARPELPIEPSRPTRPETMEIIKDAEILTEQVYEMHSEVGVLTDEIE